MQFLLYWTGIQEKTWTDLTNCSEAIRNGTASQLSIRHETSSSASSIGRWSEGCVLHRLPISRCWGGDINVEERTKETHYGGWLEQFSSQEMDPKTVIPTGMLSLRKQIVLSANSINSLNSALLVFKQICQWLASLFISEIQTLKVAIP